MTTTTETFHLDHMARAIAQVCKLDVALCQEALKELIENYATFYPEHPATLVAGKLFAALNDKARGRVIEQQFLRIVKSKQSPCPFCSFYQQEVQPVGYDFFGEQSLVGDVRACDDCANVIALTNTEQEMLEWLARQNQEQAS